LRSGQKQCIDDAQQQVVGEDEKEKTVVGEDEKEKTVDNKDGQKDEKNDGQVSQNTEAPVAEEQPVVLRKSKRGDRNQSRFSNSRKRQMSSLLR